jgi:hypothetical protein
LRTEKHPKAVSRNDTTAQEGRWLIISEPAAVGGLRQVQLNILKSDSAAAGVSCAPTATCHNAPEQSGVMTDITPTMNDDWSSEETDDPLYADRRNFYKVEKWSKDDMRVVELLYAGNNLDKARRIFDRMIKHRPRIRLTIRQRTRVLQQWPE